MKHITLFLFAVLFAGSAAVCAEDVQVGSRLYKGVEITKVEPDGVTLRHSTGAIKASFKELPESWRERFSYSPENAGIYQEMANVHLASIRPIAANATSEQRTYRDVIKHRIMARLRIVKSGRVSTVEASRLNARAFDGEATQTSTVVFDEENTAIVQKSQGGSRREIRLVEEPIGTLKVVGLPKMDAASTWSGWIYPTKESSGDSPVYSADLKIAVTGELGESAPGRSEGMGWWIGIRDGLTFPLRYFEINGMDFAPAQSRNLRYWCGAVLGGLVYPIVLLLLLPRKKKKPGF